MTRTKNEWKANQIINILINSDAALIDEREIEREREREREIEREREREREREKNVSINDMLAVKGFFFAIIDLFLLIKMKQER